MTSLRWTLLLLALLLPVSAPPVVADELASTLVAHYRAAHQDCNLQRLQELVFWGESSQRTRERVTARLTKYRDLPIDTIEFRPASPERHFEFYGSQATLKPVGWLAISFTDPDDALRYRGVSFVVGEHLGRYWIVVAEEGRR